jgi:integral membrane protein (TIGR01906 family)
VESSQPRKGYLTLAAWVVALLLPVVLLLSNVRLLLTPAFVQIEYRTPGFPADGFGFTQADRLHWAPLALEYLLNSADIRFLGDMRFENGQPLYNARELRHMADVKHLTRAALMLWEIGGLIVLILLAWLAWCHPDAALQGLRRGGLLTVVLLALLFLAILAGFNTVFVGFHRLFFQGDSWLFYYSDTLIRLFPERFWQDAFTFLAVATLIEGGALYVISGALIKRRIRSAG